MLPSGVAADLAGAQDAILARGSRLGRPLYLLAETSSTNDEARRAAKLAAPHGATWVAERQSAGRGRQGRAWFGAPGESLLFSVLARVSCPPARLPQLALVAGLAVRDAVARAALGADVRIKWPNDVVVRVAGKRLRKVAGVLIESAVRDTEVDAIIIGVGINVHTRTFPPELADTASSVAMLVSRERGGGVRGERSSPVGGGAGGENPPLNLRTIILADVLAGLDRDLELVAARGLGVVHARLVAADSLRDERVRSEAGEGLAEGIDTEGRLLVRGDDGVVARWSAGEVHLC